VPATHLFAITFAVVASAMLALWLVSLATRDVSIVDVFWGPGFAVIAILAAWLAAGAPARRLLVVALTAVWGIRLGVYLAWRNHGRGEDFRYAAMRRRLGALFPLVSLGGVFGLQAVLMWIVSLPVQVAALAVTPTALGVLDALGATLWAVGFLFESVGDWQLARFKADPANDGRVMAEGLWRYTRHPNYFGDACVWWGLYLIACATPRGWWTLPAPVLMTVFLRRISGVPMLERSLARRRAGYAEYVARTPVFFPWFPGRG
jgi:steroid 5-alpha reductase family enzyme